jgi:hypothetical protein
MFSKPDVAVGDRFTKVGTYRMPVWKVAKIYQRDSDPPHAHLEKEGFFGDSITISVPALTDSTLFRRVIAP